MYSTTTKQTVSKENNFGTSREQFRVLFILTTQEKLHPQFRQSIPCYIIVVALPFHAKYHEESPLVAVFKDVLLTVCLPLTAIPRVIASP